MARKFLTPAQLSKIIFNQSSDAGLQQGELIWDSEHLGIMFGLSASTQLEIGQQNVILSYNETGSTIPAGRAVYGTGATNNRPSISPSTSATAEQSSRTFGVTAEPVPSGEYGWVTTSGILTGIDTSLYVAGDELWLSSSSPGILVTSPFGPPNHDLLVGYCVTSSSVDGAIYLTFNRGVDVSGIHDIVLNSQANNDLIIYNSASNFWVNKQINQVPFDNIPYIDFSTASTVPVPDVAKMVWNEGEGTLAFGVSGGNIDLNIGTEQLALCYNGTGSTLTKGQVVYVSGAQGQRPRIGLALANSDSTSSKVLGVVGESIANGAEGFVVTAGILSGIDTSSYTTGDALWLSPTVAGAMTKTKQVAPNHLVFIGYVISVNASSGRIFVKPQNGYELDELHDVLITSKADNDIITYNASSSVWINQGLNAAILEVDGAGSNIDADLLDGQHGSYYLDWTNVTNKPDPVITLGGDLSGSVTLTDLGNGTLTATIGANSVALGTDTTGNYIEQITGTTDQVTVTGSGSESASVTLSLPQSIATSSSPTFAGLTTTSRITTPASVTGTAPFRIPHGTAPSSPVNGDIWTTTAGIYVRVNGSTVGPLGTGGGGTVTVSDTAPVSPSVGDLWYESDTGKLYVYYDSFWVETVGSGGAANDLSAYLTISNASATYLTQTSASTIYAPLASPTFTGTVTAATLDLTTAATATAATSYWVETGSDGVIRPKTLANTITEIVTTAAVNSASATILGTVTNGTWNAAVIGATYIDTAIARLASPTFTGTPAAPTAAVDTNTTQIATTAFVVGQGYAKLASPTFTGTPAAPTALVDTNTTQIATTAFVIGQGYLKSATASTTYAPLASPTFTGTVTAATLDLTTAATDTAATSYWVETGSDGVLRPKTLANTRTEIVTTTAVNSASATTLGIVTVGTWNASEISTTYTAAKVTSVNGSTGAVTGLATTAGNLSQFAATTSSQFAGVISDETGSGSVVFSNSPTFTGVPEAPTAAVDTNTTQVATTAFVIGQAYAKLASPTFTGTPAAPTAAVDTNTTQIATTAYVIGQGYLKSATASSTYAPLASPTFTGTPAAPTAAADTNTTQIATTAYVIGQEYLKSSTASTTYAPLASPTFTGTVTAATLDLTTAATATAATSYWVETGSDGILRPKTLANAQSEIVTTTSVNSASATVLGTVTNGTWQGSVISATYIDSAIARLASPTLSGTPTAPTATAGTNTTQIATTEFVQTAVNNVTTNTQTASYTLALSDAGKVVEMNVGSANNLTIPPSSGSGSVAFAIGTTIDVIQYGVGQTTLVAGTGVTIRSKDDAFNFVGQYSAVSLYKRGTDEWIAIGDLIV